MAVSFPIKTTFDNGVTFNQASPNLYKGSFTYSRAGDQTLIYCNQPELVGSQHCAESGYYLNKVTVNTRNFLLYCSFDLGISSARLLAVRVYNAGANSVTITNNHLGFNTSKNYNVACGAWQNYFNTVNNVTTIAPGGTAWILQGNVPASNFVEVLGNYVVQTTGTPNLSVAVYMCSTLAGVPTNTTAIAKDPKVYSGSCNTYMLSATPTYQIANMKASSYNSYFIGLTTQKFSGNANERNDINLCQGGSANETLPGDNYGNVGNWGTQYTFAPTFVNNTSAAVKIRGYVISNDNSHAAGIASGGIAVGKHFGPNGSDSTSKRWFFMETPSIAANGGSYNPGFDYMHLSKGNSPAILQFEAV